MPPSTIADRFIQYCGGLTEREMAEQVLDSMDIERERGITIKAQSVTLHYKSPKDGETYQLNFIDTPGHVDFSYEVSRSLAACESALLVVDAAVVCPWSHESAMGSVTNHSRVGREDCSRRCSSKPWPRDARNSLGVLVGLFLILRSFDQIR